MTESDASDRLRRRGALGQPSSTRARGFDFGDLFALAVPALISFELHVVGRLFVSELLLVAALPFVLSNPRRFRLARGSATVLVLGLLWLWGQIITDLIRQSAFEDYARGWLKILFTVSTFIGLSLLIGSRRRRLALCAAGFAVGFALQYIINPDVFAVEQPWKFGFGASVTLAFILLACHPRIYRVPLLAASFLFVAAALNLQQGDRSLSGVCFLTALYVCAQQTTAFRHGGGHVSWSRVVVLAAGVVIATVAFLDFYGYAARKGLLGPQASSKYSYQASGRFGIALGGRANLYGGILAIADSPIVGHGSWAKDPKYQQEVLHALKTAGYRVDPSLAYELLHANSIPAHSYLLSAWVDGGILGGIFWLGILVLAANVLVQFYKVWDNFAPLIVFWTVFLIWNVLFSPYGAEQRLIAPFAIVTTLYARGHIDRITERAVPA